MTFRPSAEQQAVIEYGLTPLRVAAGAGAGKTTALAYRMARLMNRFGIPPEQVLGVTFTNKAADELARRTRQAARIRAPGREIREIDVFTYHGFAAHLLGAYGALVGMDHDTRLITPSQTRQLLRESMASAPLEMVDASNAGAVVDSLMRLSGELADNLIRPEELLDMEPAGGAAGKRAELASVLAAVEREKHRLGVRDYGDLIRLAVELVRGHPIIAGRIRSRYRCVLLDEYQDTNPAQRELFAALFGRGAAVTAVGDLDQTIYEWRGASPSNFNGFPAQFRRADGSESETLRLSVNRRSGQRILDLANLIRTRISVTHPAGGLAALDGAAPGEVHAAWRADARQEAEEIARESHRLHEAGVEWSEMAVLFRRNHDIELIRQALEEHDVPLQVADLGGLLQVPEIVELIAWLRLLDNPEDSPALVRILTGSRFRLGLADLAPLSRWASERSRNPRPEEAALDYTLLEALENPDEAEAPAAARGALDRFRRLHRTLLSETQGASLSELVRLILSRTGAWQEIDAMPAPFGLSARLNIHRFLDFTEHWRPLEGRSSLTAFLAQLEYMRNDPVDDLDAARIGGEDAVTLITVHRAKGLEWRAVFLPALYRGNFPASPRRLLDPSSCEYTLPARLRIDPEFRARLDPSSEETERKSWLRARHYDQEWRLAYVAATRAKEYLYLSGACWYGVPRPLERPSKPSELLELARGLEEAAVDAWVEAPPPRPETLLFPPPRPGPDPVLGTSWEEALQRAEADPGWTENRASDLGVRDIYDEAVEEFEKVLLTLPDPAAPEPESDHTAVSVTGLVTYADCPKRYFWSEIDRLPRRASARARRGTVLHRRIELHNRGMIPFEELREELYDRTPDEVDEALPESTGGGWRAFIESPYANLTPVYVEAPFEVHLSPDVRIRGRVDAVYPYRDGGWEIVDFKSGRRSRRASAGVQLQAYAVAACGAGLGAPAPEPLRVSFVYLGGGLEVAAQEVDGPWLEQARNRIDALIEGIRSERFDPSPSGACRTCDFQQFCEEGRQFLASREEEHTGTA